MLVQWLIVVAVLTWSVIFMLRRFLPALWREDMAAALQRRGWARLAQWLLPAAAGCGSGCSSCSPGCASQTVAAPAPVTRPVQWRDPGSCH